MVSLLDTIPNTLVFTATENGLTIFRKILLAKAKFRKYLMEECYSQHSELSFKYFIKSFSISKLLSNLR